MLSRLVFWSLALILAAPVPDSLALAESPKPQQIESASPDDRDISVDPSAGPHRLEHQLEQGFQQLYTSQLAAALDSFRQAAAQFQQTGDRSGEAQALLGQAETFLWLGQSDQELQSAQQAFAIYQALGDRAGQAEALHLIGDAYLNLNQFDAGLTQLQAALQLRQELSDRQGEGWTLGLLGIGQVKQGELADGLKQLQEALSILSEDVESNRQLQQQYRRGVILAWIGNAQWQLEDDEPAAQSIQAALTLSQSIGNRSVEMLSQFILAALLTRQDQPQAAISAYQRAQALAAATGNFSSQAWAFYRLGEIYKAQAQSAEALAAVQQALEMFRSIGDRRGEAQALDSMGYIYIAQQQFTEARDAFEQEIIVAQQIPDRFVEVFAISGLGNSYSQQGIRLMKAGSYAEAIPVFEQSRQQWERTQTFTQAHQQTEFEQVAIEQILITYSQTAYALSYQQQYPEAIAQRQRALEALESYRDRLPAEAFLKQRMDLLAELGIDYFNQGEYAASLTAHQESAQIAAQLSDFAEQVQQLQSIASRHTWLNQYSEALAASQQALAILRDKLPEDRESEISLLTLTGQIYSNSGEYSTALEYYQQALAIARDSGNLDKVNSLLNNIGTVYSSQGRLQPALASLQDAWQISQSAIQRLESEGLSIVEQLCGSATASLGTHGLQTCLGRFQYAAISTLNNLASIYNGLGRYPEALDAYQQVTVYAKENQKPYLEVTALGNLGLVHQKLGNYDTAQTLYRQSLEIAERIASRSHQAYALNNLGQVYNQQGQYPQALELSQQALTLAQQIGEPAIEASVASNIGTAYDVQGKLAQALAQYQAALAIQQQLGQPTHITLNNIAFIYQTQGRFAAALETYQQALDIARSTEARNSEATTLSNIAGLYADQGEYAKALEMQQQASSILQQLGGSANQLAAQLGLGRLYFQIGQYDRALSTYQQALTLSREIGEKPSEASALSYLGGIYLAQAQLDTALSYFQQASALTQAMGNVLGESRMQNRMAQIYRQQGQLDRAYALLEQALKTNRAVNVRPDEGKALNSLGLVYADRGQFPAAIEALQQAIAIHRDIGDRASEAEALANLGGLYAQQNQPEIAITFYKQSVNLTEQIRQGLQTLSREDQESYTNTITDRYRSLADLLISQKRLLEAERVLELLRLQEIYEYSRSVVTASGAVQLTPAEQSVIDEHQSLIAFAKAFADCNAQANCDETIYQQQLQLNREWNAAVDALESEAAARDRRADDQSALGLTNLASVGSQIVAAQPDTVMIYPVVQNQRLSIFWIMPGGISNAIQVEIDQQEIATAVSEFRQLMKACEVTGCTSSRDLEAIQAVSQRLYAWLMPPQLQAELEQNQIKNLVFALDRFLRYIPIAALYDGNQYLIEQYALSTVTLTGTQNPDRPLPAMQQTAVLGLGLSEAVPADPNRGIPYAFNQLDNVDDELGAIVQTSQSERSGRSPDRAGIFPGVGLLNQDFDLSALRTATQYQILHIATHGYFNPINSYSSFLVLGTKEPLTLANIRDLGPVFFGKLSLVVLSACETALGEAEQYQAGVIPDGKELTSIAHTFVDAGVDTIVASLWQVNDPATAILMRQFYANLAESKPEHPVTIAEAMRNAQLSLINQQWSNDHENNPTRSGSIAVVPVESAAAARYAHPYYWSAFTIMGNGL